MYFGLNEKISHLIFFQDKCLDWFPRLRAISLAVEDVDGEQNEWKTLQGQVRRHKHLHSHCHEPSSLLFQLDQTQTLVQQLSSQLADLRDQMTEQRKHKQRMGGYYYNLFHYFIFYIYIYDGWVLQVFLIRLQA